jgi:YVTN family beta-propeller protein
VISTASDKVVAKLPLSGTPSAVAFSPSGTRAYVATSAGLWIYSTQTRQVLRVIRGLGEPRSVAVSPDGRTVYVTATDSGAVAVINAANNTVTRTIKVGELPWQVIVSADGQTVYVANPDSNTVSVIDATTGTVSHTISVAGDPETLALTPNGQRLWVGGGQLSGARYSGRHPISCPVPASSSHLGCEGRSRVTLPIPPDRPRHHPDARVVALTAGQGGMTRGRVAGHPTLGRAYGDQAAVRGGTARTPPRTTRPGCPRTRRTRSTLVTDRRAGRGGPIHRPRMVSTMGVNGWCSANPRIHDGSVWRARTPC